MSDEIIRKLATIQKVVSISPIEGADRLEMARVLGWQLVVKKGEFSVGDLGVYFEVDSVIPDNVLIYAGLWDEEKGKGKLAGSKGNRLKTIKLRGQISQGLLLPLSDFTVEDVEEGKDLTEELGVEKYEPPIPVQLQGVMKGNFPSFLIRTDAHRLQNYPSLIQEMYGRECYITIKIDGTSCTFYNRFNRESPYNTWGTSHNDFGVCSRNVDLKESEGNLYWQMSHKYDMVNILKDHNLAVQGEVYGPSIQKNRMGAKDIGLKVFDVFDIHSYKYFNFNDLLYFCNTYNLPMVDVIYTGEFKWDNVYDLIDFASKQLYVENGDIAEGIIIRPTEESYSEVLSGRLSFKVISPEYLARYGN